ncbi:MAG TPA: hypothetical protein VHG09_11875 [Longimicrobiales bacterium]|nr:hypothetical protein [Longimicrobiales bacterium]
MNHRMTGGFVHRLKRLIPLAVLIVAACEDPYGPALWDATPDTLLIYSASRPVHVGRVSAVDITRQPALTLPLEAPGVTGQWDIALTDFNGELALAPASAFEGVESRSRIGVDTTRTFENLTEAPRDTLQFGVEPLPLRQGDVYIVRSRRASCGGVSAGYRYGKLRPITIDEAAGTLTFELVVNPYCDNRSFVPPEE